MPTSYLFRLSNFMFAGYIVSFAYVVATGSVVWLVSPRLLAKYAYAFCLSFNCLTSSGVIITAALFVFFTKRDIPEIIENSFEAAALSSTKYPFYKRLYLSLFGAVSFSTNYIIGSFFIFYLSKFPFDGWAEIFLITIGCAEYGLIVYVGRKLYFIAKMLGAISNLPPTKNVFRESRLGEIISYVNILSTVTVIAVYLMAKGFYEGPFVYNSVIGSSVKLAMLLPALIFTPVIVLFNFYPRYVLRKLYSESIATEVTRLSDGLRNQFLSEFERLSYAIEYDRLQKDDLKNSLQLTLSDLPMAVTIVIMLIGVLVKS